MKYTIDFETRSACNLKKHGAHVYSEHPTTDVLCLVIKAEEDDGTYLWIPGGGLDIIHALVSQATEICAHNASFERAIWENVCVKRYGWPELPIAKLRCSAAQASSHALPRSLGEAGAAIGLAQQKDYTGYKVMMRLCKPRKPRKGELTGKLYWHEDQGDLKLLYEYCKQDVIAEEALSQELGPLPARELAIWQLDQEINNRGVAVDLDSARNMIKMVDDHSEILLARLQEITEGEVKTAKQVENMRVFLLGRGCELEDLSAASIREALQLEWDPDIKEVLEIRRSLARSSAAKYQSILDRVSADGRVRGSLLYHGAGTGRWSGAGIQPQNFPSRIPISDNPETMLRAINIGGLDLHNALYDDDPMATAGAVTRSILVSGPGKDLIVADYSAVEGRGLAWEAGEEPELEVYRSGQDTYIAAAAGILHKMYDEVTKEERSRIGKTATLACGYGGSVGAVRKFADMDLTDDEIKSQIVYPWRDAHPMTVKFWSALEEAAMLAVQHPGMVYSARAISFVNRDNYLKCRLPSGRLLYYYSPRIMPVMTSWGEEKEAVTYMTVDSLTKKWVRVGTYGGKLSENVTQAICRDLMADAMLRVEAAGYTIVLTVHDEIIAEVPEDFGSVEEFVDLMCIVPAWAHGFPVAAAGWRGKRYKK